MPASPEPCWRRSRSRRTGHPGLDASPGERARCRLAPVAQFHSAARVLGEANTLWARSSRASVKARRAAAWRSPLRREGVAGQSLLRLPEAVLPSRRAIPGSARRERRAQAPAKERALRRKAMDRRHVPGEFRRDQPDALRQALDTRGEGLARGIANLLADVQRSASARPTRRRSPSAALAVTPGDVVYENDLVQLIQYKPVTPEARRPLVVIPPCINKYYILDLQPENSFVAHALAEGAPCSWSRGAISRPSKVTTRGTTTSSLACSRRSAWREIANSAEVNALGFCVGGTFLGAALAVLAAKGATRRLGDLPHHDARFLRHGADRSLRRRAERCAARIDHRRRRRHAGDAARLCSSILRSNDGVALCEQQLPEGSAPPQRSPVLEFRAPICPDRCSAIPAQHLSREQALRSGRAHELRRRRGPEP